MDAVDLARLQFAFTIGFHILWPTFTIGIAWFITLPAAAVMSALTYFVVGWFG